jgi:heptosyltransferase-3
LQFKSLGDTVMMVPALKAIHDQVQECTLHALVREEAAPLLQNLPWLTRVWTLPRVRGRANLRVALPIIRGLRRERFQYAIDVATNDRTAILTFLSGAKHRLGAYDTSGFFGRRLCFTVLRQPKGYDHPEVLRLFHLLEGFGIRTPGSPTVELRTDAAMDSRAEEILKEPSVLCHLGASGAKKEWPLAHWAALFGLAKESGIPVVFSSGLASRERALLAELQKLVPGAPALPEMRDVGLLLSVLKRASVVVTGDTGPAHFASGLGVPTIVLYGPTSPVRWAPVGRAVQIISPMPCSCDGAFHTCRSANPCLASIRPARVFETLQKLLGCR